MGFTNIFKGNSGGAIAFSPKDNRPISVPSLLVPDDRVGSRSDRLSTKVEPVGFAHCGAFVAWDSALDFPLANSTPAHGINTSPNCNQQKCYNQPSHYSCKPS
jgi:hypothetical protein